MAGKALQRSTGTHLPASIQPLVERARAYQDHARSDNTRKAYTSDWREFQKFCDEQGFQALPSSPGVVGLYITDRAEHVKTSTLRRHMVAIGRANIASGAPDPTKDEQLKEIWKGIKRAKGTAPSKKAPILTDGIKLLVQTLDLDTRMHPKMRARNKALLLIGFAGAFRRSELVALRTEHLTQSMEGLTLRLERSKANQEGKLEQKAMPYGKSPETCPVRALRAWIDLAGIREGYVFRPLTKSGRVKDAPLAAKDVAAVIKRAVGAAGLDKALYSGHSLRRGFITQSIRKGRTDSEVMKQTGHKNLAVMRGYFEEAGIWESNAVTHLDL